MAASTSFIYRIRTSSTQIQVQLPERGVGSKGCQLAIILT